MQPQSRDSNNRDGDGGDVLERYEALVAAGRAPGLSTARIDDLLADPTQVDAFLEQDRELAFLCDRLLGHDASPDLRASAVLAFGIALGNRAGVCSQFPYDQFWSLSLARAIAASELSIALGAGRPEKVFLLGLVARVGAVAFAAAFPRRYGRIVASASVDHMDELRSLEREQLGLDHVQMSYALLRDLGVSGDVLEPLEMLGSASPSSLRPVEQLVLAGERIAELCVQGDDEREAHWLELVDLRRELGMERDTFTEMGDRIVREWWSWGESLRVPTRALPSFYTLDNTSVYDRRAIGRLGDPAQQIAQTFEEVVSLENRALSVLIVDDEPTALLLLRAQIERGGHDVLTASNGTEAFTIAQKHVPDVVIADWLMPEMDGLDLCRALRRCEAGRNLYFVLLTGREEDEHVIEAFDAGVDDFITKPAREGMLLARMNAARRVLELRRQVEIDQRVQKRQLSRMALLTRQAREAALTDSLTELPNRRYATRRLHEEWSAARRSGRQLSLVMLDVDHFKAVNDSFGHEVGDDVLRALADVLENATRQHEVACRFGGEEFVVVCTNTSEEGAHACGERIRAAVETEVGQRVELGRAITVSVGIATFHARMRRPDDLVGAADEAVYAAKAAGRNRTFVFEPSGALPSRGAASEPSDAGPAIASPLEEPSAGAERPQRRATSLWRRSDQNPSS